MISPSRKGFSLVELLVVIAIIFVALMLAVPAMQNAMERTRLTKCSSNLRQVTLAMLQYSYTNNGILPQWNAGRTAGQRGIISGGGGVDRNPPWSQMLVDAKLMDANSPIWKCPLDTSPKSAISYTMNSNAAAYSLATIAKQSQTILLTERYDPTSTRAVNNLTYAATPNATGIQTNHRKFVPLSFVDGHMEILPFSTDPNNHLPPDSMWMLKD